MERELRVTLLHSACRSLQFLPSAFEFETTPAMPAGISESVRGSREPAARVMGLVPGTLINVVLSLMVAVAAFLVSALAVAFTIYRLALGDAGMIIVIGAGLVAATWAFTISFKRLQNP